MRCFAADKRSSYLLWGPSKTVNSEWLLSNYLAHLKSINDLNQTENAYFIMLEIIILCWEAHESLCVDRCCKTYEYMSVLFACDTCHFINQPEPPTPEFDNCSSISQVELPRKVLAALYCDVPPKSFALQVASVGLEKQCRRRLWKQEQLTIERAALKLFHFYPKFFSGGNVELGMTSLYFKRNHKCSHL